MTAPAESVLSSGRQTAVLVLLVTLLVVPSLFTRELMPTDEPRFALVARQMVEDPAPIVPHLGYDALTKQGEVYADKPPVFFWLISFFSFFTGGVSEASARLPSFFAAIAAVLLTRRIGALLVDEGTGFLAALVLATMSQFLQRAFWCSIDMVLTAFVMAAVYCWLRAAHGSGIEPSGPSTRKTLGLAALGGFFAAAATLSKGPVGLIFPLAYLAGDRVAARLGRRKQGEAGAAMRSDDGRVHDDGGWLPAVLIAAAAFLLPVGVWMSAAFAVGGPTYLVEILFKQNVTRYVAAWNNIAPWYYYFFRIPLGLFPWTLMLPGAIMMWWMRLQGQALDVRSSRPDAIHQRLRGLLIASATLFVFFSASTGKRGVYLLPLYPALAILIAAAWNRLPSRQATNGERPLQIVAWVHVIALCLAGLAALVLLPRAARHRAPDLVSEIRVLAALMAAGGCLPALFLFKRKPWASATALVGGVALITLVGSYLLVPGINRRAGVKAFGPQLAASVLPGDHLVVDAEGYEQILFYSGLRGTRRDFNETRIALGEDGSVILESGQTRSPRSGHGKDISKAGPESSSDGTPAVTEARAGERTLAEAERARRRVQFPAGGRVVFVVKGPNVDRLRSALGPSSRVLLATTLYEHPYYVVASRAGPAERGP